MKKYRNIIRAAIVVLLPIYIYAVLHITLLDRSVGIRRSMLTPFWELRTMLQTHRYKYWLGQIGGNLIMLMPLGFMLPALSGKFGAAGTVVTAFAFSLFIEITQYFTGRGLCEFDDLLHNTLGGLIGYFIFRIIYKRSERSSEYPESS